MINNLELIFITNEIPKAAVAECAGVDRVMVDLEINGKLARQGHRNTLISRHHIDDVRMIKNALKKTDLLVRINPINQNSSREIGKVINEGADIIMLPMFHSVNDVGRFLELVAGRARTCLLLETSESLARAEQILSLAGIDEVHVGLNDLHMSLGLDFMFELLSGGLVEHLSRLCSVRDIKFGFGGVARLGSGRLSPSDIISEHVRLRSSQVILSRDFHALFDVNASSSIEEQFVNEVRALKECFLLKQELTEQELEDTRKKICVDVEAIRNEIVTVR